MQLLFKILGILSMLLIGIFIFFARSIDHHLSERCEYLAKTAENEKNIEYMQTWVSEVAIGNKHQNIWSDAEATIAIIDGEVTYIPSPAWEKIGLDPKFAHLRLTKTPEKYHELLSHENIETIEYGVGRDSIIIKVNHPEPLNIRNKLESSRNFKKITNNVYVYCDGASF